VNGGKAERAGPLGETAGGDARADGEVELIAGIGADGERNAEPLVFGYFLELVVVGCQIVGVTRKTGDEGIHFGVVNEAGGLGEIVMRAAADGAVSGSSAVHHDAGFLFDGHALQEIGGAFLGRSAPVFVGIELTVLIEVFKGQASLANDFDGALTEFGRDDFRFGNEGENKEERGEGEKGNFSGRHLGKTASSYHSGEARANCSETDSPVPLLDTPASEGVCDASYWVVCSRGETLQQAGWVSSSETAHPFADLSHRDCGMTSFLRTCLVVNGGKAFHIEQKIFGWNPGTLN